MTSDQSTNLLQKDSQVILEGPSALTVEFPCLVQDGTLAPEIVEPVLAAFKRWLCFEDYLEAERSEPS